MAGSKSVCLDDHSCAWADGLYGSPSNCQSKGSKPCIKPSSISCYDRSGACVTPSAPRIQCAGGQCAWGEDCKNLKPPHHHPIGHDCASTALGCCPNLIQPCQPPCTADECKTNKCADCLSTGCYDAISGICGGSTSRTELNKCITDNCTQLANGGCTGLVNSTKCTTDSDCTSGTCIVQDGKGFCACKPTRKTPCQRNCPGKQCCQNGLQCCGKQCGIKGGCIPFKCLPVMEGLCGKFLRGPDGFVNPNITPDSPEFRKIAQCLGLARNSKALKAAGCPWTGHGAPSWSP